MEESTNYNAIEPESSRFWIVLALAIVGAWACGLAANAAFERYITPPLRAVFGPPEFPGEIPHSFLAGNGMRVYAGPARVVCVTFVDRFGSESPCLIERAPRRRTSP